MLMEITLPLVDGVRDYTVAELNNARKAVIAIRNASLNNPENMGWAVSLSVAIAFLSAVRDGMES